MRKSTLLLVLLLPALVCGELETHTDEKGVTITTRNEKRTFLAAKTEKNGRIAASVYFEGYRIVTMIGWTDEVYEQQPEKCLFQRRMSGGRTNKDKPLGLSYAFLRRGKEKEVFQIAHEGEIIDAYYISESNEMTPLSVEQFEAYRKEREASRE